MAPSRAISTSNPGTAGAQNDATSTIVQGDIKGDGKPDFEIGLLGYHVLNGAVDFDL